MKQVRWDGYLIPEIEVIEVELESGFAQSTNIEDPDVKPEQPW